jgi:exodeoxyribonuclease V alpha subunit
MTSQLPDYRVARGLTGVLAEFNQAGLIESTDIHVATTIGLAVQEDDPIVQLAVALVVAHTRAGSVCLDLATVSDSDSALQATSRELSWPETSQWLEQISDSPVTQSPHPPLTLRGTLLYLDRYLRHEDHLLQTIRDRRQARPPVDAQLRDADIARLFSSESDEDQEQAVAVAVDRQFAVIAGGPGTGKTTTIAKIVAALRSQLASDSTVHPMIGLTAPTGRAAARLQEAVRGAANALDVDREVAEAMADASAATLHRLLGWQPGNRSRFVHHKGNPLPHDVVIVDECSMISLALMDQLLDAVRPDARVVLVGDPQQLASVDAGSVFGDIVSGAATPDEASGVVVLSRVHRFGGAISELAAAILAGDCAAATKILRNPSPSIAWYEVAENPDSAPALDGALAELEPDWLSVIDFAARGDTSAASRAVTNARVLCAHREGSAGVSSWNAQAFWMLEKQRSIGRDPNGWFVGRPLLITENDYQLGVLNGDSAVVVEDANDGTVAVFDREPEPLRVNPERLGAVQTAFASTVHKSQGSQFGTVVVVLPNPDSHVLSRELLYTAVTRAVDRVILVGSRASLDAAVNRRSRRASGLGEALRAQNEV